MFSVQHNYAIESTAPVAQISGLETQSIAYRMSRVQAVWRYAASAVGPPAIGWSAYSLARLKWVAFSKHRRSDTGRSFSLPLRGAVAFTAER